MRCWAVPAQLWHSLKRPAENDAETELEVRGPRLTAKGTSRDYYLFDALGSVTGLTDSSGAVSERYDYEPYGGDDANISTSPAAVVGQGQFGFAGGYRSVGDTGKELYHDGDLVASAHEVSGDHDLRKIAFRLERSQR